MMNTTSNFPCNDFYFGLLGFTATQSDALCANATFSDPSKIDTYFALLNIYFYGDIFNP